MRENPITPPETTLKWLPDEPSEPCVSSGNATCSSLSPTAIAETVGVSVGLVAALAAGICLWRKCCGNNEKKKAPATAATPLIQTPV